MKYFSNDADSRFNGYCVYCGDTPDTKEHVPPKSLLDKPYPSQLHVVEACSKCNNSYSKGEEYMACLIECVVSGTVDPEKVKRDSVRKSLNYSSLLRDRIKKSKISKNGQTIFKVEEERIEHIIKKIAVGHVHYELNLILLPDDAVAQITPLPNLDDNEREAFEAVWENEFALLPEVGSRAMHRLTTPNQEFENGWVKVQQDRYRYAVKQGDITEVRMVLSEYLFCKVVWDE